MHSVHYARANNDLIDEIVISTDDKDISFIAKKEGLKVIERPASLATDFCATVDVLKHVLETLALKYDNVILLQATNPLRPKLLLNECLDTFKSKKLESLFTVSSLNKKFGKITSEKFIPQNYNFGQRFQDLENLYFENGLIYISKAHLILNQELINEGSFPFIVNHPFSKVDIDTQEDFEFAELYFKFLRDDINCD